MHTRRFSEQSHFRWNKDNIDILQPPVTSNYMVRPGQPPKLVDVISELGIFGYVIGWDICDMYIWHTFSVRSLFQKYLRLLTEYIYCYNTLQWCFFQEQGKDHNKQAGNDIHDLSHNMCPRKDRNEKYLYAISHRLGTCWGPNWATSTREGWLQAWTHY